MSEENLQRVSEGDVQDNTAMSENQDAEAIELRINKATNEIYLLDHKTGRKIEVKATIVEDDEDEDEHLEVKGRYKPLTPHDFQEVFRKLSDLGITWSADFPPVPKFKKNVEHSETFAEEYHRLQKEYPRFPRELGALLITELMGKPQLPEVVGDEQDVQAKLAILRETLPVDTNYRSEFFFKHAIKVPYFEDADWEIVIKAYERGVKDMPKIAYALLSLAFRKPIDPTLPIDESTKEIRRPEFVTVAVNEYLLDKLIGLLVDAKDALEKAQHCASSLADHIAVEEDQANEQHNKRMA